MPLFQYGDVFAPQDGGDDGDLVTGTHQGQVHQQAGDPAVTIN